MYGTVPYFLAKTLLELPISFLATLEMMLISYWVMGLNAPFMELVLIVWMLALTTSSLAILVSCVSETAQKAMEIMPALISPQIMFAGIFVATSLMPWWLS